MDGTSKQKMSKKTSTLCDTLDEMNLTITYRTFCPSATEYIFFSNAYGTLSRVDHI